MTRAARLLSALDGALVASHLINDGDLFGARGEQYVPTLNLIDGMVKDEGKEGEEGTGEHLTGEEMAALCNARRVLLGTSILICSAHPSGHSIKAARYKSREWSSKAREEEKG